MINPFRHLLYLSCLILWAVLPSALAQELQVDVPFVATASLNLDFDSPSWKAAAQIEKFEKMGGLKVMGVSYGEDAAEQTRVLLMRDAEALYLGFECMDNDPATVAGRDEVNETNWPKGDTLEIYIDGNLGETGGYYHFAFNPAGSRWQANNRNRVAGDQWKVVTGFLKDRWRATVRIPFSVIGLSSNAEGFRGMLYRMNRGKDRSEREQSTWGGQGVQTPSAFGRFVFTPTETP